MPKRRFPISVSCLVRPSGQTNQTPTHPTPYIQPLLRRTPPKRPPIPRCSFGLVLTPAATAAPVLDGMTLFPRLVVGVRLHGGGEVVADLLEVQHGDVVVGDFAARHEAADAALAQLLLLALDGPRGEADAGGVVGARDEDGAAAMEEVVTGDVVAAAEDGGGDAVAEGEGGDCVRVVVEEVEGVLWGRGG